MRYIVLIVMVGCILGMAVRYPDDVRIQGRTGERMRGRPDKLPEVPVHQGTSQEARHDPGQDTAEEDGATTDVHRLPRQDGNAY